MAERATGRTADEDRRIRNRAGSLLNGIREQATGERLARRNRVAGYRNHFVAHSLTSPLSDCPADKDVFTLMDETVPLAEAAHCAVFERSLELADWHRINAEYTLQFWSSVRMGQKLTRDGQCAPK